jgi:hypothetical protein
MCAVSNTNAHSYVYPNTNSYAYSHSNANGYCYGHCDRDFYTTTDAHAEVCAHSQASSHTSAKTLEFRRSEQFSGQLLLISTLLAGARGVMRPTHKRERAPRLVGRAVLCMPTSPHIPNNPRSNLKIVLTHFHRFGYKGGPLCS